MSAPGLLWLPSPPDNWKAMLCDVGPLADPAAWNALAIVVEAERQFGVKFQTGEIEDLKNVGDSMTLIEKKTR